MYSKEDILYRSILIASVILGVIILGFILFIIRHQRRFTQRHLRNIQTEIAILEKERKKIAADLHDGSGALLSLLKLKIESLHIQNSHEQDKHQQCIQLANTIIEKTRRISEGLMPVSLLNYGIVYAVQEFTTTINENSSIEIIFEHDNLPRLPSAFSTHIFRMIQEIIHNTLKHANADTLKIELKIEKGYLLILTADDGTGFDLNDRPHKNKGLGLRNLKNRTTLLKGNLNRISSLGGGTRYHIKLLLP